MAALPHTRLPCRHRSPGPSFHELLSSRGALGSSWKSPRLPHCRLASKARSGLSYGRSSSLASISSALEHQARAPGDDDGSPTVLVKICGLTRPEDAAAAAQAGARFAGMILWPKAGRYVEPGLARRIAEAARTGGAEPVGVFVDEGAEEISRVCSEAGVTVAQLHGNAARAAFGSLPEGLRIVYVAHVDPSGNIVTPLPSSQDGKLPDWLLLDGLQGGSGVTIDWEKLVVPLGTFQEGWILAGGLTPANVGAAVLRLSPSMVDVSSGVCGPDKLAKDHSKIREFVESAKGGLVGAEME